MKWRTGVGIEDGAGLNLMFLRVQALTTINLFRNVQVGHCYTPQMIFTVCTSTLSIGISDSSQARSNNTFLNKTLSVAFRIEPNLDIILLATR